MPKIKIAFIKFGGLSMGGSELWLQKIAANLPKDKFYVDYYYCDSAPLIGSDFQYGNTNQDRIDYMKKYNVNLIKFHLDAVDMRFPYNPWIKDDFWKIFDYKKYDLVQTVKAGPREYPFYLINLPVVEIVALANRPDKSKNIAWSFHSSDWQRNVWLKKGGDEKRSSVLPAPLEQPLTTENYREELNIPKDAVVAGFHQRPDNNIYSEIPLNSFSKCQNNNWHFIIKGGGNNYKKQAEKLNLKNIHFLPTDGNNINVSKFLNTLDFFAHGRKDGETFGAVLAEALIHGKPCLSHYSEIGANAQKETMGSAGLFALNKDDYTEKLYSLFNNSELRRSLASKTKRNSIQYSIEDAIAKITAIYKEILSDKSRFKIKYGYISKIYDKIFSYAVFIYRKRRSIF